MLTSAERQSQIKAALADAPEPITASAFGKKFGVSRQTVVGDIALLRAQGTPLIATPRGYRFEPEAAHTAVVVCKHTPEQAGDEIQLVIDNGGVLVDVLVDHPLYGQLRGELQIANEAEKNLFLAKMEQLDGHMLSELTGGIHLHTIAYDDLEQFKAVKAALRQAGFLYE
ncbi:MAG: transcription repressor NadR [Lactobacillus sp.]|jgi:transcriptional regulator of NAD metabolism|nr:transcription repressor NadR [Lactobacillus sp.]MCI2032832.1 transcription repressor NadR [Lactobacillus sp.]